MRKLTFYVVAIFTAWLFTGCVEDTFGPIREITPEMATPKDLKYATVINAREGAAITSGIPTVETGGLIPTFEITAIYDGDGNQLGQEYMDFVSIVNPTTVDLGKDDQGNPIEVISYRKAGTIQIQSGHPFVFGTEYGFDIAVTAELNGVAYRTVFPRGFTLNVIPNMPSSLLFVPMAQNLVVGESGETTSPYIKQYGENLEFGLLSCRDTLVIDPATGAMSLAPGFVPDKQLTVYPSISVRNTLSNETRTFEGSSSLLTIVISSSPVEMPLQTNYFFNPTFGKDTDKYKYIQVVAGDPDKLWVNDTSVNCTALAMDRPAECAGSPTTVQMCITKSGNSVPHESWFILQPQDLTSFGYGFNLKAVFWIYNRYIIYLKENGVSPSFIVPMVSTTFDYKSTTIDPTQWQDISDKVSCTIFDGSGAVITTTDKIPYPGSNAIQENDAAAALKDPALRWDDPRWLKCEFDLSPYKNESNVTIAFRVFTEYTLTGTANGRAGRFYVGGVYYYAQEQAQSGE